MNKRQKKKKESKELTLIIKCSGLYKAEEYVKMRQVIQSQLDKGNVVVLPHYLSLEGIIGGGRVAKIKITKEGVNI